MPYKKVYYTIHCPKCDKDYQVLTQAYIRKIKDTKYGTLCKSCRAKVQLEEMSEEQKIMMYQKSQETNKAKRESMTEEQKQEAIKKRTEGTKKMWALMSDEERIKKSEKRSKDRINFLDSLSNKQKREISNKISETKLERSANMSKEEKAERKRKKQEDRKIYWDNLSNERREELSELLRNINKEYWNNITPEELEKRSKSMTDHNNEFWSNKSKEERIELSQKMIEGHKQWRGNLTEKDIEELNKKISDSMIEYWNSLSDEEMNIISEARSNSRKEWLSNLSEDEYNIYIEHMSDIMKQYWSNLSKEEREKRDEDNRNRWNNLSEDIKKSIRKENIERWENYTQEEKNNVINKRSESFKLYIDGLTEEERSLFSKRSKDVWDKKSEEERQQHLQGLTNWRQNLTKEEKDEEIRKQHQWLKELTVEERIELNNKLMNVWNNMSIEKRNEIMRKILSYRPKNSLQDRFEKAFNESHLINDYYLISEKSSSNETIHSWDYGIYNKLNNELVMVVDLDGEYFHADNSDYDGLHSKEEYDERRSLSIPEGIKHFIIQENNFSKCFELMVKTLMLNYDEYVDEMFKIFRSMPFPSPKYTDKELYKSLNDLYKMKCDDKYHKDISLNTRVGDRLIQHFHESIYRANRKGKLSPYDAWYDDKLLKECIQNRIIYQNYLNPNKILQGFNVSKIAMKVSVFSAGRAKMLIHRYLSDCNEIFDPFSGFSGRMLGAISLGKKYIGQDISPIHVRESNNMIKYMNLDNIFITQQDILKSSGTYECLFTCSPYSDIEQWLDVPCDERTCDDWIDECLSRFKCRKYLFVVDNTDKYKDYIVDVIVNKSHFGSNNEYVIMIQR